jgi:hypothetical protein
MGWRDVDSVDLGVFQKGCVVGMGVGDTVLFGKLGGILWGPASHGHELPGRGFGECLREAMGDLSGAENAPAEFGGGHWKRKKVE